MPPGPQRRPSDDVGWGAVLAGSSLLYSLASTATPLGSPSSTLWRNHLATASLLAVPGLLTFRSSVEVVAELCSSHNLQGDAEVPEAAELLRVGTEMRWRHVGIGALLLLSLCLQAHAVLSPCDGGARTAAAGAQTGRAAAGGSGEHRKKKKKRH